jgi:hypothetical protein
VVAAGAASDAARRLSCKGRFAIIGVQKSAQEWQFPASVIRSFSRLDHRPGDDNVVQIKPPDLDGGSTKKSLSDAETMADSADNVAENSGVVELKDDKSPNDMVTFAECVQTTLRITKTLIPSATKFAL